MEKLKSVISGGRDKNVDDPSQTHSPSTAEPRATGGGLTGAGSHLAGAHPSGKDTTTSGTGSEEYHPIYDQFTGHGDTASGLPTRTSEHTPHFSNTTNVKQDVPGTTGGSSHLGRDAALGAGATGAGGVLGHGLDRKPEDNSYDATRTAEQQPHGTSLNQPTTTTDTDRSFPLAGGVVNPRSAEHTTTSEREPGTKERGVGVHDGQGREALAGAAAAATASSALPRDESSRHADTQPRGNTTGSTHHPDALAAATAAASRSHPDQEHTHGGHGHAYGGDPCPPGETPSTGNHPHGGLLFTSGPHATDTANRLDPKLHVPGEFPSPTPQEEPAEPSYLHNKGTTASGLGGQPELRHTGTLNEPHSRSDELAEQPTSEHHYGRDAALAGGLGAAGAGAHEAGKHHQKEPTDISGARYPTQSSPYSSTKLDPRVDSKPSGFSEQRYDPVASEKHHGRDAALTGGTLGAGALATHETTKPHHKQENIQPTAGQTHATNPATSTQPTQRSVQPEDERSQHHYGRDATLAGGALGAGGLAAHEATKPHERAEGSHPTVGQNQTTGPAVQTQSTQRSSQPIEEKPQHHHGRDAALTGGTLGAGALAGHEATKPHDKHAHDQPTARQTQVTQPTTQAQPSQLSSHPEGEKSQHHYGRDAALVGAGAGTTAGLYSAQRANEPDSGPASSTIGPHQSNVANALDPRVQPDPALQKHHHALATAEDPAPSTVGPHKSDIANIVDPRVLPDPQKQKAAPKEVKDQHHYGRDAALAGGAGAGGLGAYEAAKKYDEHRGTQPGASLNEQRYDPAAPGAHDPSRISAQHTEGPSQPSQHHYGRDAAAVGGLGAAGAGTYAATHGHDGQQSVPTTQQHPVTQTGQQPPTSQAHQTPLGTSQKRTEDPQQHQHHYGRDAAAAGGLGAAGAGAYAATRDYDRNQQPSTVDPTTRTTQQPQGTQAHQSPIGTTHDRIEDPQKSQHHYGRDAAVAGGLGAAGAGTYAATRDHDHDQQPHGTQASNLRPGNVGDGASSASIKSGVIGFPQGSNDEHAALGSHNHPEHQLGGNQIAGGVPSTTAGEPKESQHHYGRDAAVAGGLGAAGAGAYEAGKHHQHQQPTAAQQQYPTSQTTQHPSTSQAYQHPETAAHQRGDLAQDPANKHHDKRDAAALGAAGAAGAGGAYAYSQHDAEKERQAAQKAHEQQLKDQQKEFDKNQKAIEKQHTQEQKHHDKLVAAEDKKHHKEAEKAEKQHQKEIEKEEKKHQKELEKEEKEEEGEKKKHHLFGFLHRDKKDKDKTSSGENSPRESRDSPRHSKEYAGAGAAAGGAAAYEAAHHDTHGEGKDGRHKLHKDPPPGHPAREALEQQGQNYPHDPAAPKQHVGIDGPIGSADQISGDRQTSSGVYGAHPAGEQHHTVTEPHTGLPMNVDKYGTGQGGIDGNQNIGGHHQLPQGQTQGQTGQHGVTDWEAIRKANTPY